MERVRKQVEPRDSSPLAEALSRVGDRWTLLVVAALLERPRRFNDLLDDLPGIAPNVLSDRLRRLEQHGLVVARPYSERPPRYVYEPAAAARELAGALTMLADWGARHSDGPGPPGHGACGTPLEARWFCPACEIPVDDAEAEDGELV